MSDSARPIFVFLDESGQLDFSSNGSKHFVLAAVTTLNPLQTSSTLQKLKYKFLANPLDNQAHECFHASEDKQLVRDQVFLELENIKNDLLINYIWADKTKTHPTIQSRTDFYSLLGSSICKYLLKKWKISNFDKVIIVFDKILTNKEEKAFLKKLKPELKALGKPYSIYFHQTKADFNSQIADYAAWAKYVALEKNEMRPMNSLKHFSISDFDIFQKGSTHYY